MSPRLLLSGAALLREQLREVSSQRSMLWRDASESIAWILEAKRSQCGHASLLYTLRLSWLLLWGVLSLGGLLQGVQGGSLRPVRPRLLTQRLVSVCRVPCSLEERASPCSGLPGGCSRACHPCSLNPHQQPPLSAISVLQDPRQPLAASPAHSFVQS